MYVNVLFISTTDFENQFSKMTEDLVIDVIHFLQPLYLLHLCSTFVSLLRYMFVNGSGNMKFPILLKTTDGIDRQILQLDNELLKAADLATSFIMFYMVPPWISCFVYFIIFKILFRGFLSIIMSTKRTLKVKVK